MRVGALNRAELVARAARATQLTRSDIDEALDAILGEVSDALAEGRRVVLVGFGSFEPAARRPRRGRDPRTGEWLEVPALATVRFRAGSRLRSRLPTDA